MGNIKRLTIDWVGRGTKLLSELALVDKVQVVGDSVVGLGQHLDTSSLEVVARSEAARGTTAKSDAAGTDGCKRLECVDDGGLDGAGGSAREVERKLDLPAMLGSELGKNDEAGDLALLGLGVDILPVRHILPRVHICEVDLLALGLPAVQPVRNTFVDLLPELIGEVLADGDIVNLNSFLLCVADLALHLGILETLDVIGVHTLLSGNGECAPVELGCKHLLHGTTTKQPQRLDLALLLDVAEVR